MTTKTKIIFGIILLIFFITTSNVMANTHYGARGALSDSDLTLDEMLTYAIQDEYLARSEYEAIIKKYGEVRPFSNIIRAEQTHIDYLLPLFPKYNFVVPEDTSEDHIAVPVDFKTALELGVQAEIDNIAMYERFLTHDLPDDVRIIFERLKKASQNHLGAFKNKLSRY
jgi:hypothetical protein